MKFVTHLLVVIFSLVGCQSPPSSKVNVGYTNLANIQNNSESSSIRKIDFKNFTFPWTKTFGYGEKSFTLKNGTVSLPDERKLSLSAVSYVVVADELDEQALVEIEIGDVNATYHMLYVYAVEKGKPKLLQSFEFGSDNIYFATAFAAHGELIIERYIQDDQDPECCPSIIEISYYKWQKNKFVQQGESQKIANGYVERLKKKNTGQ